MKKLKLEELERISTKEFKIANKIPVCLVLENVRSLHNVGSAFRTADAFRIEKIWLTGITGTPPHREINKTALGATESVDWEYANQKTLLEYLKNDGYRIAVVEQTDQSIALHQFTPKPMEKFALIFGNEVDGISQEMLDQADLALEIPQFGTKHSLNISVCLGIVVWTFFKNLSLSNPSKK